MMPPNEDDRKLVAFLKHHRSPTPPAAPDLEDRMIAALPPMPIARPVARSWVQRPLFLWVPSALTAGLLAALVSHQALTPTRPNAEEVASLEAFIETTWQGTVNDTPAELVPLTDPGSSP